MTNSRYIAIKHAIRRAGTGVCIRCGEPVDKKSKWPRCLPCERHKQSRYDPVKLAARNARRYQKDKAKWVVGICKINNCSEAVKPNRKKCICHLALDATYTAKRRRAS